MQATQTRNRNSHKFLGFFLKFRTIPADTISNTPTHQEAPTMSNRTVTTDYQVTTAYRILSTFRTHKEARDYVRALQRTHFLTDDETNTLTIETRKANR
jgi:hypothetical protein